MKKYVFVFIIIFALISGCIYLVFNNHENLTITYIKFKVNPEFIVGINNQDKVVFYNPLNDEAKIFNLNMFSDKTLDEMCEIFYEKMNLAGYLLENGLNITVVTKNSEKKERLVNKISDVIKKKNSSILINSIDATDDELLAYSNEIVYDLKPSLNKDDLVDIALNIEDEIINYVDSKIRLLKLNNFSNEKKIEEIKKRLDENYFNDYKIVNYRVNGYNLILSDDSRYDLELVVNEDFSYYFSVHIDLVFENYVEEIDDEIRTGIVEEYLYSFDSEGRISNYKNKFYKFNY